MTLADCLNSRLHYSFTILIPLSLGFMSAEELDGIQDANLGEDAF